MQMGRAGEVGCVASVEFSPLSGCGEGSLLNRRLQAFRAFLDGMPVDFREAP
jgi:hypothetical protein